MQIWIREYLARYPSKTMAKEQLIQIEGLGDRVQATGSLSHDG